MGTSAVLLLAVSIIPVGLSTDGRQRAVNAVNMRARRRATGHTCRSRTSTTIRILERCFEYHDGHEPFGQRVVLQVASMDYVVRTAAVLLYQVKYNHSVPKYRELLFINTEYNRSLCIGT